MASTKGMHMKRNLVLTILALIVSGTAHANWQKIIYCQGDSGSLVVDHDSSDPEKIQFVIEGRQAVQYVQGGIQGNAQNFSNLHIYDGGNKLVISDLKASKSLHPSGESYSIRVIGGYSTEAITWWFNLGDGYSGTDHWSFYNCRYY